MDERRLRRACRQLLRSLDIRPPLDMVALAAAVGEMRGRRIVLLEHPLSDDEFALSWNAGDVDIIVWRPHTSPWHRDHSLAHEIGHVLCGHLDPGSDRPRAGPAAAARPGDLERALSVLRESGATAPPDGLSRRACYEHPHEVTVELIATTLLQWSCVPGRAPAVLASGSGLSRALAWRRGWL